MLSTTIQNLGYSRIPRPSLHLLSVDIFNVDAIADTFVEIISLHRGRMPGVGAKRTFTERRRSCASGKRLV